MTIKQGLTLRNFMIILCICMLFLLGQKALRISDKIDAVQEGGRLYAAGDLIAAENWYRQAAANPSIHYKEGEIAERLEKLAPITAIRSGLSTLVLSARDQAATKDFAGFMNSYNALLTLKAEYMKPGGPYESYYRQLSAASGISDKMTASFQQFKKQFLTELEQSGAGAGSGEDSFKWNLLKIPDVFYGGSSAKQELLDSKFQSHDTARLKALAAAGSFGPLLDSALSMLKDYNSRNFDAPWIKEQTEASGRSILGKDLDGDYIIAFAEHAVAYRKFAGSAGITSSKMLAYIDSQEAKLLKSAARKVRNRQFAEAIRLYSELRPLQDNTEAIAAARLAWNLAEPVRLLPGGEEQGRYSNVISGTGKYGAKVYVAGTDSSGRLYYALMNKDESVTSLTGDPIPGFAGLRSLLFEDTLGASSGLPVILAETDSDSGRIDFTAYEMGPQGISLLFSLRGDSYELQPDGSIILQNADIGDGVSGQTAIYRKSGGTYQFSEIVQEYPLIQASELELYPYKNVSLGCEIYVDNNGNTLAYSDGRYILLQGNLESMTGSVLASGQFQESYETVQTEYGEENVPVFVVASVGSRSFVN